MIYTGPLPYIHRDRLRRVIRLNDVVAWTNASRGQGLVFGKIVGATTALVQIERQDSGKMTRVNPESLIVITQQVIDNVENNVGSNVDLEEIRRNDPQ